MEINSKSKSIVKPALLVSWLVAVGLLVFFISTHQNLAAKESPIVAEVLQSKGEVLFRGEKKIVWNDALSGTGIVDGDRVATGKVSSALVKFRDGRTLALGGESQVIISTITHSDSGLTFLVHLVKGTVIADSKKNCTDCRDIVMTSGGQSFVVSKGKKEGFIVKAKKIEKFSALRTPD